MGYIYKTTNNINNKIYIGLSLREHDKYYMGSGKLIKAAFKQFGKKNFTKEILEDNIDMYNIDDREKFWIANFNSTDTKIGYNITNGGSGWNAKGIKRSKEFIDNIKRKLTGVAKSDSHKDHILSICFKPGNIPWNKGLSIEKGTYILTDKQIESYKLVKFLGKHKGQVPWNAGVYGVYNHTEETKLKQSLASKGKPKSEAHKKALSEAHKGKSQPSIYTKWLNKYGKDIADEKMIEFKIKQQQQPRSDKAKHNMSIAHKGTPLSETHKKSMSAARKGKSQLIMFYNNWVDKYGLETADKMWIDYKLKKQQHKSDETKNNMSIAQQNSSAHKKKIVCNGNEYISIKDATYKMNMTKHFIMKKINDQSELNWYMISELNNRLT